MAFVKSTVAFAKPYVRVHALVVLSLWPVAVFSGYPHLRPGGLVMDVLVVVWMFGIAGSILLFCFPLFSLGFLIVSLRERSKELLYWGLTDTMLSLLHVMTVVAMGWPPR